MVTDPLHKEFHQEIPVSLKKKGGIKKFSDALGDPVATPVGFRGNYACW